MIHVPLYTLIYTNIPQILMRIFSSTPYIPMNITIGTTDGGVERGMWGVDVLTCLIRLWSTNCVKSYVCPVREPLTHWRRLQQTVPINIVPTDLSRMSIKFQILNHKSSYFSLELFQILTVRSESVSSNASIDMQMRHGIHITHPMCFTKITQHHQTYILKHLSSKSLGISHI